MLDAEVDLRDVEAGFAGMAKRARNLRPALRPIRDELKAEVSAHFSGGVGPNGARWPSWASSTQQRFLAQRATVRGPRDMNDLGAFALRAQKRGFKNVTKKGFLKAAAARRMERVLGRLPRSMRYKVGANFVEGRNIIPWSGVHDQGGTVGRGAHLPARTFAFVSDALQDKAADILAGHIAEGFKP